MCYNYSMEKTKNFTISNVGCLGFEFFKKSVVVFFALMLCFNGFIPKNQNFKDVFIKAFKCAVGSVEFDFVDGYAKRISGVTKTIATDVLNALKSAGLAQPRISKDNSKTDTESVPVNTPANNAMLTQRSISVSSLSNFTKTKLIYSYSVNMSVNALYILYNNMKVNCDSVPIDVGILYFILFSIFVVKIKDVINNIRNNKIYYIADRLG